MLRGIEPSRALARIGEVPFVERLFRRLKELPVDRLVPLVRPLQRFGEQRWRKFAARWPALADLLEPVSHRVRVRVRKAPEPVQPTQASALLQDLERSREWQVRAKAAAGLFGVPGKDITDALCRARRDRSAEVAVAAVESLAGRPDPDAIAALSEVLANSDGYYNPITRAAALRGLAGTLSDAELSPVFEKIRDLDAEVSLAALAVLAERSRETVATHLLPVLEDASGFFLPIVRLASARGLERAGALQPEAARALLERESDPGVRVVLERVAAAN